jgi:hypothetical protein
MKDQIEKKTIKIKKKKETGLDTRLGQPLSLSLFNFFMGQTT